MPNGFKPELIGNIDVRLKQVEDKLFLTEQLPLKIGKAVATEIANVSINVTQATWWQVIDIPLDSARNRDLYGTYIEKPDCVIYLPDSTGTATIYLDSPTSHGFAMGTTYKKIRGQFTNLYITNTVQSGKNIYLLLAKGDVTIESYTMTPIDLQAQYRPIIASTTTPLNASQIYTSSWYDCNNYSRITLLSASNVASASNGVEIQQSTDGSNADYSSKYTTTSITISGTTRYIVTATIELMARYARIVYTNGGTNQSYFRLAAMARVI